MVKLWRIGSNVFFISAMAIWFLVGSACAEPSSRYDKVQQQIWMTNFLAAVQKDPSVLLNSALIGSGSIPADQVKRVAGRLITQVDATKRMDSDSLVVAAASFAAARKESQR
jgi:hypothetical protein